VYVVFPVMYCRPENWNIVTLGQGKEENCLVRYCIEKLVFRP